MVAVFSSHCLEHVSEVEAWSAVQEMYRVLNREEGFAIVRVPNLLYAARLIAEGRGMDSDHWSNAGPVRAVDMVYGYQVFIAEGKAAMRHCFGYTPQSIGELFERAGFGDVTVAETREGKDITVLAFVKEKARGKDMGGE